MKWNAAYAAIALFGVTSCASEARVDQPVAVATARTDYKRTPGQFEVATFLQDWIDDKRSRTLPVKIYYAPAAKGPQAVVIFSHGLGGSREGGAYLGEHLASYGYVAVHLQHPGSDEAVWRTAGGNPREALVRAVQDPTAIRARFTDPAFAIDHLLAANKQPGPLEGRIDGSRIGISGHSFGSHTALVAVGERIGPQKQSFAEPRFRAAIVYSPAPPRGGATPAEAFASIQTPIFHFTGTNDRAPQGLPGQSFEPRDRQVPFESISKADQYLVVLDGADHELFSGRRSQDGSPRDLAQYDIVRMASTAFWDAYLLGDAEAREWLKQPDGLISAISGAGEFKRK